MLFVLSLQIATLHFRHGVFKWCMHFDIKGREARGVLARMVELGGFCFLFVLRVFHTLGCRWHGRAQRMTIYGCYLSDLLPRSFR